MPPVEPWIIKFIGVMLAVALVVYLISQPFAYLYDERRPHLDRSVVGTSMVPPKTERILRAIEVQQKHLSHIQSRIHAARVCLAGKSPDTPKPEVGLDPGDGFLVEVLNNLIRQESFFTDIRDEIHQIEIALGISPPSDVHPPDPFFMEGERRRGHGL